MRLKGDCGREIHKKEEVVFGVDIITILYACMKFSK